MTRRRSILADQRIGIFGKGGSGKSTVTVLLAKAIASRGVGVCILDADSTNIGMHTVLGLGRRPRSLIDYFGGTVFCGGRVSFPVDDPTSLPGADIPLACLPMEYYGRTEDNIILLSAGKIGGHGVGSGCDGPISKIVRDIVIRWDDDPHLWLVDHKAGFEDTARGVSTKLDWAIVVVGPSIAGV
jgi:CO dehydrogenase maturation factor